MVAAEMEQQAVTRLSLKGNRRKRKKAKARVIFRLRLPAGTRQSDRHDMWRIRTQQKSAGGKAKAKAPTSENPDPVGSWEKRRPWRLENLHKQ